MAALFDLTGQKALVTGCSRGIGLAIASGLARAGADIIGVRSSLTTDEDKCEQGVRLAGRSFSSYVADLSDREAVLHLIDRVRDQHGTPDILVNNAGIIRRAPAAIHPESDWDAVLATNLDAPFLLAREFGRDMCARKSGKIIFIASLLTFQGGINVPGYAASKGAIGQLTKALSNEWAGLGVNVNAIAPGYVSTDNTEALRKDASRAEQILSRIPAGRWGTPDDFVGPAVFLSSQASDYIHGEILVVDGGWMGR